MRQKQRLKKVAAVITISETSRKDIVRFLDVPQEKINVIHLAPRSIFRRARNSSLLQRSAEKYKLTERFILYIGDVNYNKNVEGLIKAYAEFKRMQGKRLAGGQIGLVLVGKAFKDDIEETRRIVHLIEELGIASNVIIPGFVPDEDLVDIYKLATLYCQPSFYEGFGLPVLEAMAAGVPVVAAKTQSLVEIAEGAALFVNPSYPKEMAQGIYRLLSDQRLRQRLVLKGRKLAERFSWERVADETISVYKKLV
jgi:glycosyltransferase involved in cell wall biosynthesis